MLYSTALHRVVASALEAAKGSDCHGVVNVFADRVEIVGAGYMASASVAHRPSALRVQHRPAVPTKTPALRSMMAGRLVA